MRDPSPLRQPRHLRTIPYDAAPWNFDSAASQRFRNRTERSVHNLVHRWVGGTMMEAASPNDPVFWLHHCNLDRLWAVWQRNNPDRPYRPSTGGPTGHNLDDPMWPWSNGSDPPTPRKVLQHATLSYTYDDEPA